MPPKHVAQTSTEVKKAYKKNGPAISERTHKQLQRGHELEQRAAREREAEKRRKLAREKRLEKERKEEHTRKQMGVGLATQLIGYSHTQANLKKGMEAFLGVSRKKAEEKKREEERKKEEELAKKLEVIAQDLEREPFDDDDMDDAMLDLPVANIQDGGNLVDDDLDDDTLLEAHDLIMSDPIEEAANETISVPPRPATAPPTPQKITVEMPVAATASSKSRPLVPASNTSPAQPQQAPAIDSAKEDIEFTRIHGPVNRVVEAALNKLPGELIELLSQDISTNPSDWNPAQGLLYKLNPIGLPPHRLRVKVGCVVTCLRDLNTSSQLSKSQHVRILRVGNERLECLTLDGQLAGTNTVITRVPFPARYRNDNKFPFIRTQYPVRVATDYISTDPPREVAQSGFKIPSINGKMRPPTVMKEPTPPISKPKSQGSSNPSFKLPGLPASKVQAPVMSKSHISEQPAAPVPFALDGWDDFLESGTQIARELSAETAPTMLLPKTIPQQLPPLESVPPLSTQDLDFSPDDLNDDPELPAATDSASPAVDVTTAPTKATVAITTYKPPFSVRPGPLSRTANIRRIDLEPDRIPHPIARLQKPVQPKPKRQIAPPSKSAPPSKKPCLPPPHLAPPPLLTTTTTTSKRFSDFGMSTQEATSFFDDDDELAFGSPPIAV